jgi:hypothetical protein
MCGGCLSVQQYCLKAIRKEEVVALPPTREPTSSGADGRSSTCQSIRHRLQSMLRLWLRSPTLPSLSQARIENKRL